MAAPPAVAGADLDRARRARLARLYALVFVAADEALHDARLAAQVARVAFLHAMVDGLP